MPPPMGASGDSACNFNFELTALGCVDVVWLQSGASVDEILDRKKDTVGVLKEHADEVSRLIQEVRRHSRLTATGRWSAVVSCGRENSPGVLHEGWGTAEGLPGRAA
jgi:hypothetical protein